MSQLAIEIIENFKSTPALAVKLVAAAPEAIRPMLADHFAEHFDGRTLVIARRDDTIVGWLEMSPEANDSGPAGGPPGHQIFPIAIDETPELFPALLRAAAAAAGTAGIGWHADTGGMHEEIATALGARISEEVSTLWEWTPTPAKAPALPPGTEIQHIEDGIPDDLLDGYAALYSAARIEFCAEDACTTQWTGEDVTVALDWRTPVNLARVLTIDGRLVADLAVDVVEDEAQLDLVQHNAPAPALAALLLDMLETLTTGDAPITIASLALDNDEPAEVANALKQAGFRCLSRGVNFHLTA